MGNKIKRIKNKWEINNIQNNNQSTFVDVGDLREKSFKIA